VTTDVGLDASGPSCEMSRWGVRLVAAGKRGANERLSSEE